MGSWVDNTYKVELETLCPHNFHSDQSCAGSLNVGNSLLVAGSTLLILFTAGDAFSLWLNVIHRWYHTSAKTSTGLLLVRGYTYHNTIDI